MNNRGRQALIDAQMRGVRQVKFNLYWDGGFCAGGVLLLDGGFLDMYGRMLRNWVAKDVHKMFSMTHDEWTHMVHMNNVKGYDFIKIANELPDTEADHNGSHHD